MESIVPPPPPHVSPVSPPEKVDYLDLPCPIPYEEIHREALTEVFEGFRFDLTKGLNPQFALSHSVMGTTEVPSRDYQTLKMPTANYEFGVNFMDPKLMMFGRLLTDGRLNARVKWDLTDDLSFKANALLTKEPHMSHGMFNFDYKGHDYRSQFQFGNGSLFGANYIQSVTPNLSLGGEVFWTGQHRKSGIGYAARYNTEKMVCDGSICQHRHGSYELCSEGVGEGLSCYRVHVQLLSRDAVATVGYDYILRQERSTQNGCVSALLEERLNMGLQFILSAEIDHKKKDYKFGFGLTVGQ
ncbi:hypothetical protein MLD38_009879 [Melastoma candidum]|uniref:Uncharacterized protein n=1 Tax=Melastoma candidum TaxID=119954 RepID=A0ACB9S7G9_9MYRT|nr:hypothetical protein MLD38_009879 [Melastoma candidum]